MVRLQPMPIISQNVPAYTNDDDGGAYPASNANNTSYGQDNWRTATVVAGGVDSGPLTQPVYLAYDLSGVPSSQRQNVVLVWYNDPVSSFDPVAAAGLFLAMPQDYTIETNTAAGGSYPASGWTVQVTVTGNAFSTRQHPFNMSGANWVRLNITGGHGSASHSATNIALNMDIHAASLGNNGITFFGDSLGAVALNHDDGGGLGLILPAQVNQVRPRHWPYWEQACTGGYTAFSLLSRFSTYVPLITGSYVVLQVGANDANQGGALLTNYTSNMQSIINTCASNGIICIIPHIHWARTTGIQTNGPTVNGYIDALIAANPTTTMAGFDAWTYFSNNQSLITTLGPPDNDGLHPTNPAGMAAYRTQTALWAATNLYGSPLTMDGYGGVFS